MLVQLVSMIGSLDRLREIQPPRRGAAEKVYSPLRHGDTEETRIFASAQGRLRTRLRFVLRRKDGGCALAFGRAELAIILVGA